MEVSVIAITATHWNPMVDFAYSDVIKIADQVDNVLEITNVNANLGKYYFDRIYMKLKRSLHVDIN